MSGKSNLERKIEKKSKILSKKICSKIELKSKYKLCLAIICNREDNKSIFVSLRPKKRKIPKNQIFSKQPKMASFDHLPLPNSMIEQESPQSDSPEREQGDQKRPGEGVGGLEVVSVGQPGDKVTSDPGDVDYHGVVEVLIPREMDGLVDEDHRENLGARYLHEVLPDCGDEFSL